MPESPESTESPVAPESPASPVAPESPFAPESPASPVAPAAPASPAAATLVQFAPSLLSADFLNLERDVRLVAAAEPPPEWLHIDVMDGHFVPNLTVGPGLVRALRGITDVRLDVHLMINNPAEQLDWYLDAGADLVTLQVESHAAAIAETGSIGVLTHRERQRGTSHTIGALTASQADELASLLGHIREAGALAGIALNPDTPVEALWPLLRCVDLVLVMSVHPGFGGQALIASCVDKVRQLAAYRLSKSGRPDGDFLIQVDGGIGPENVAAVCAAGADILVAGNAVFGTDDPVCALAGLRAAVSGC
ncbi:MAG: ribulose-phosphate 3-epimerase [Coriobacteriales bacterium]|jgi:ribulose-phosphate 3-epimerase|nr:ribulose-phosphate 3-epimerase [Coriobacteriales bacterium]